MELGKCCAVRKIAFMSKVIESVIAFQFEFSSGHPSHVNHKISS